jgi:hypothetical protein
MGLPLDLLRLLLQGFEPIAEVVHAVNTLILRCLRCGEFPTRERHGSAIKTMLLDIGVAEVRPLVHKGGRVLRRPEGCASPRRGELSGSGVAAVPETGMT